MLVKDMALTVVIKLLCPNIGFISLQNKIFNLWRPLMPFHLMDIENGYYLIKFQGKEDYDRKLSQGSWIVFGQCLTVQFWSTNFDRAKPYPSIVKTWVRFPDLSDHLYNRKILWEIGELVGKVVSVTPKILVL